MGAQSFIQGVDTKTKRSVIDIANMGESALKSHMNGDKHRTRIKHRKPCEVTLKTFGFNKGDSSYNGSVHVLTSNKDTADTVPQAGSAIGTVSN